MILIVSPFFMKYCVIGYASGITLWPFVIVRNEKLAQNARLINHERIHLRQQIEMGIIFFYVWYLLEYFIRLVMYRSHYKAYRMISFEQEAYDNDKNFDYVGNRRLWGFLRKKYFVE